MIVIKFGRWNYASLKRFTYERIYTNTGKWTPFCIMRKKPKCPNGHRCPDCIHCDHVWEGVQFRGFKCRINAR